MPSRSLANFDHSVATDRREFLRCTACGVATLAALSLAACGGESVTAPGGGGTGGGGGGGTESRFEITASQIKVFLAKIPDLTPIPSFFLIDAATTVVLHTAENQYAAFTAICTHAGCTVSGFSNNRMVCPCHGSEYDLGGSVVVGPAPAPLKRFSLTFDAALNQLLINRG